MHYSSAVKNEVVGLLQGAQSWIQASESATMHAAMQTTYGAKGGGGWAHSLRHELARLRGNQSKAVLVSLQQSMLAQRADSTQH